MANKSGKLLSQAQQLWVISRSTGQRLVAEKFLFTQAAGLYNDLNTPEEQAKKFSERIVEIWSEGHSSWQEKALSINLGSKKDNNIE